MRHEGGGDAARISDAIRYWGRGGGDAGKRWTETRISHLRKIIEVIGDVRLDTVSPRTIKQIQSALRGRGSQNNDATLTHSYINQITHHTLRWAMIDMEVEHAPSVFMDPRRPHLSSRLKEHRVESTDYWTMEERDVIISAADRSWPKSYSSFLRFAFYTGARLEEIIAIQWSHVDMTRGTCKMVKAKGDRVRKIELSTLAIGVLHSLGPRGAETYVFRTPKCTRRPALKPIGATPEQLAELRLACADEVDKAILRALAGGAKSVVEAARTAGVNEKRLRRHFNGLKLRTRIELSPVDVLERRRRRFYRALNPPVGEKPLNLRNFGARYWQPLMRSLEGKVPAYPMRCTRHTFAFVMVDAGWNARKLARHLGNSWQMIEERYVKPREGLTREQQDEALGAAPTTLRLVR